MTDKQTLVRVAVQGLEEREGTIAVSAGALAELKGLVEKHARDRWLGEAAIELCLFAVWIEREQGATDACAALLGIAKRAKKAILAAGGRPVELADALDRSAKRDYASMLGAGATKYAAPDAPAPEGSIKASPLAAFDLREPSKPSSGKKRPKRKRS